MSNISQFGGGAIKSIQRGVIAIAAGSLSATATISAVTPGKTELRFLGSRAADNAGVSGYGFCTIALTNSTTITAQRETSGTIGAAVSWELTEFY